MEVLLTTLISIVVFCVGFLIVKATYTTHEYVCIGEFVMNEYVDGEINPASVRKVHKMHKKKFVFGKHKSTVEYFMFEVDGDIYEVL